MRAGKRLLYGMIMAAMFSGIAMINVQPYTVVWGWAAVGFAVGAAADILLVLIAVVFGL